MLPFPVDQLCRTSPTNPALYMAAWNMVPKGVYAWLQLPPLQAMTITLLAGKA